MRPERTINRRTDSFTYSCTHRTVFVVWVVLNILYCAVHVVYTYIVYTTKSMLGGAAPQCSYSLFIQTKHENQFSSWTCTSWTPSDFLYKMFHLEATENASLIKASSLPAHVGLSTTHKKKKHAYTTEGKISGNTAWDQINLLYFVSQRLGVWLPISTLPLQLHHIAPLILRAKNHSLKELGIL